MGNRDKRDQLRGKNENIDNNRLIIFGAYLLTVSFLFTAGIFPEIRLWGLNWWSNSAILPLTYFLITALTGGGIIFFLTTRNHEQMGHLFQANQKLLYLLYTYLVVSVAVSFFLFRENSHFLGDGYQLLSRLSVNALPVKFWDFGTTKILAIIMGRLPESQGSALLAYQIFSVGSGILFLSVAVFYSHRLFENNFSRLLFFLGISSGGYLLLFFGHVENYSLFVTVMFWFCLQGLLTIKHNLSLWPLLLITLLLPMLHIFGLLALPGFLLVLFSRSNLTRPRILTTKLFKFSAFAALAILFVGVYTYLRDASFFYKMALLPFSEDLFTTDNYTLFSLNHLLDLLNLIFLLFPGLFIFITIVLRKRQFSFFRKKESVFLLLTLASFMLAGFVFDPRLGMPRDWDLFSFIGLPLVILAYYFFCLSYQLKKESLLAPLLAIFISGLIIVPRVAVGVTPELAAENFKSYLQLDRLRGRNGYIHLINFYQQFGSKEEVDRVQKTMDKLYPEERLSYEAELLISRGNYKDALPLLQRVLQLNPIHYDTYSHIGYCYLKSDITDSALSYLKIADGINPFNASTLSLLGVTYYQNQNFEKALEYFGRAQAIDPFNHNALAGLVTVNLSLKNYSVSLEYVSKLFVIEATPFDYFQQAGDNFVIAKAWREAGLTYDYALKRGLDSAYVVGMKYKFPQLSDE